jgi:hypothetical protein
MGRMFLNTVLYLITLAVQLLLLGKKLWVLEIELKYFCLTTYKWGNLFLWSNQN